LHPPARRPGRARDQGRDADVFVENYRPDVKHRLGIGPDELRAVNPRLVYASISGFGQDGPAAQWPGFDSIAQGMGGLMSVTGQPGAGPMRVGIPIADLCAGHFCAMGILSALLEREATGEGQWVQTSLLEAQVAMLDYGAALDRLRAAQAMARQPGADHFEASIIDTRARQVELLVREQALER